MYSTKLIFLFALLASCSTQHALRKKYNKQGIQLVEDPISSVDGDYLIMDYSVYARPTFMLNLIVKVDSLTIKPIEPHEVFTLEKLDNNKIHIDYSIDSKSFSDTLSYKLVNGMIKIKTKSHFKGNPFLWAHGKSKILMTFTSTGKLVMVKENSSNAFILLIPAFASSENFEFDYDRL